MGRRKARRSPTAAREERVRARNIGRAKTASCGKLRYTSLLAAQTAANLRAQNDDRYPEELRVYYHGRCNGFHITSQRPRRS